MEENKNTNVETQETKTYTQEEVDKMLQVEGDKRVSAALKKQQKKFDEAQKLANMSTEEKQDYEYNQKISELNEREAKLAERELIAETEKQLGEKGLPTSASAFIVGKDAETTMKNITSFEEMFNKAIEAEIGKRIATGAPKAKNSNGAISKEEFKKMNLAQQANLFKTNPELYKQLTNN